MSIVPAQVDGGGVRSGILFNSSLPAQVSRTITISTFEETTSVIVTTSTLMTISTLMATSTLTSVSEAVNSTTNTFTISVSATITATSTVTLVPSSSPTPQGESSLPDDSIIISSVLGGSAILLIPILALIYYLFYKHRKRQHDRDYSPSLTSLTPPTPRPIRLTQSQTREPEEISFSTGPSIYNTTTTPPLFHRPFQGTFPQPPPPIQQQQRPPSAQRRPPKPPRPPRPPRPSIKDPIPLHPHSATAPPQPVSPTTSLSPSSRAPTHHALYHELLRQDTEKAAAQRHGRIDDDDKTNNDDDDDEDGDYDDGVVVPSGVLDVVGRDNRHDSPAAGTAGAIQWRVGTGTGTVRV